MQFTPSFLDLGAIAGANAQPLANFSKFTNPTPSGPINAPLPTTATPPARRKGIGGFFDHIEQATQSPLFGLGVGLLSGSPQQGFQNARSLARDQNSQLQNDEFLESIAELAASGAFVNKSSQEVVALLRQLATQ